jgi:hypothetical protein
MLKKSYILFLVTLTALSCKKNCSDCRMFKVYDGEQTGTFETLKVEEACGYFEERKYTKQTSEGKDSKGEYHTLWRCGFHAEDDAK